MAKKIDFKQLLVQKGERLGFIVAAVLLVVFLGVGGYIASTSASATGIVNDFDSKIKVADNKINGPSPPPPEINPVTGRDPVTPYIDFTRYRTPNEYFFALGVEHAKRVNPHILPVTEARATVVRGATPIYDINDSPTGKTITVVVTRKPTQNDKTRMQDALRRSKSKAGQAPRRGGPPPGGGGGPGAPGGGGAGGGLGGGGRGGQGQQRDESELVPKSVDDKELDKYVLAEDLQPLRMVVVEGSVPFKAQVEEYVRALKVKDPEGLTGDEMPQYHGLVVERMFWDREGRESEWKTLDLNAMLGGLFAKVVEFEPANNKFKIVETDPGLAELVQYVIPDGHGLVYPRPKLVRGQYEPIELKSIDAALKKLKDRDAKVDLHTRRGRFDPPDDVSGMGGTSQDSRTGGGMTPPGGAGDSGATIGQAIGAPGSGPRGGRAGGAAGTRPILEDAWLFRFIDISVQPGNTYAYRVRLKAYNPNFGANVAQLSYPKLADQAELISEPYTLPERVEVPVEEFVYAAANDKNKETERRPTGNPDETFVQMHKWLDYVRPNDATWTRGMGEWVIADLRAVRGQKIGETVKLKMPSWDLVHGKFLFRENPRTAPRSGGAMIGGSRKAEPVWSIDFVPNAETLVVDFDGGRGDYTWIQASQRSRATPDTASAEILLLSDDGKLRTLHAARSDVDLVDPDRVVREDRWRKWLEQVQKDTDDSRQQGQGGGGPGAPGGGGR